MDVQRSGSVGNVNGVRGGTDREFIPALYYSQKLKGSIKMGHDGILSSICPQIIKDWRMLEEFERKFLCHSFITHNVSYGRNLFFRLVFSAVLRLWEHFPGGRHQHGIALEDRVKAARHSPIVPVKNQ